MCHKIKNEKEIEKKEKREKKEEKRKKKKKKKRRRSMAKEDDESESISSPVTMAKLRRCGPTKKDPRVSFFKGKKMDKAVPSPNQCSKKNKNKNT